MTKKEMRGLFMLNTPWKEIIFFYKLQNLAKVFTCASTSMSKLCECIPGCFDLQQICICMWAFTMVVGNELVMINGPLSLIRAVPPFTYIVKPSTNNGNFSHELS